MFRFGSSTRGAQPGPAQPPPSADADPSLPVATCGSPRSPCRRMLDHFRWLLHAICRRRVEAAITYAPNEWLARQILGFGADIGVLPAVAADRVRARPPIKALAPTANRGAGAFLASTSRLRMEVTQIGCLQPWHWIILIAVVVLLFGSSGCRTPRDPFGKSMRIFKSELKGNAVGR